ncbi:MAG: ABC transporter substrate-binding protein [Bacteroidia bacterium]|nr:ABC transporter substrate-binding protein [Bacteroidia bacterium]
MRGPQRIIALTEETTEWLYLLGEQDRLVGISAYTERPVQAKAEKPVVSAYIGGSVKKIKALKPDLVIGFSDVQAELARELITENLQVLITNQRSVEDIFGVLEMMARIIGAEEKAEKLLGGFRNKLLQRTEERKARSYRPKVYFEEWDEPAISAIEWVSELVEMAGGDPIFADRAKGKASKERYVKHQEVLDRNPDIFIACWCGKPLDKEAVLSREGYKDIPAIKHQHIYEMDPAIILQPGPACLTDGFRELCRIIDEVYEKQMHS